MTESRRHAGKISANPPEYQRFNSLKNEMGLSDSALMQRLLDCFNEYQETVQPLERQLQTYQQRELKALSIGDAISDGIYITDREGMMLEVNKQFCRLVAMEEDQLIGTHIQALVDRKILTNPVGIEVLKKKEKVTDMSTIQKTRKKVLSTGNPFFDKKGNLVQVLVVMRDITELIRLKEDLETAEKAKDRYRKALEQVRLESSQTSRIIGQSDSMQKIKELISQISHAESTVLITGETGVGKEVIAGRILEESDRKTAPYIRINCAAMPESLMESELFGYEKGAFTGARPQGKAGVFEMANQGTILLDEIGDMPLNLQPKLLRVLQEKEVTRIGDSKPIKLDVRVLATTNQNLSERVKQGKFRKDLFYRINVIPIHVPPLRDRKEDIPLLVEVFLNQFNTRYHNEKRIGPVTLDAIQNYDFPGNVRELKNIVERLVVTGASGTATPDEFYKIIGSPQQETINFDPTRMNLKEAVARFERQIVRQTLKQAGSTYKAARILGISQPSVVRKSKVGAEDR